MPLPRQLFTPAFRSQHLGRSFAVIVGIMVFIATFAVAAEAGLLTMGYAWGQAAETRITVEIPALGDESTTPQADRVKQAIEVLRAVPGVGLVVPLAEEDVARLLKPWFSQPELLKALPLPTLIDVVRKPDANVSAEDIETALKNVVSDARVDDHGAWTQDVWRLLRGLAVLGGVTIGLMGITLFISVNLICRSVMATEHETIGLLHILGTDDRDIAHHFQLHSERIAARAAALGFAAALTVIALLLFSVRHIADLSALHLAHWAGLGVVVFLIPVGAIAIASMTARHAVLKLIQSFP